MNELYHYGIKGMHWGIRRYQNPDGTLTEEGKKRYDKVKNKYTESAFARKWAQRDRRRLLGTIAGGTVGISSALTANTIIGSAAFAPYAALGAVVSPALIPTITIAAVATYAAMGKASTQLILRGAQGIDNAITDAADKHKNEKEK